MSLLRLNGVTKRYGALVAVNALSLTAEAGRITSLIGPNGAGKTTVINLITGVMAVSAGQVQLNGVDISGWQAEARACQGISRTYQTPQMINGLTALENVEVGADMRGRMRFATAALMPWRIPAANRRAREMACDALRRVGLDEALWHREAAVLSYGDQRKVELARALTHEPKVILLDEPAAGLNPRETEELGDYLRAIAGLGIGIVLVEHDMPLVMRISDEIKVICFGEKLAEGTPDYIRSHPEVIAAYLGSSETEEAIHG